MTKYPLTLALYGAVTLLATAASAEDTTCDTAMPKTDIKRERALLQVEIKGSMPKTSELSSTAEGAPPQAEDYEEAYNYLYDDRGYHSDTELTHEEFMINEVKAFKDSQTASSPVLQKVVFLGCSHGKGASMLHDLGFETYGVDVASKAVEMANNRSRTCGAGTDPCFVQGSLTELPYSDSTFDAGVSADVLEHIAPDDVPKVVKEISRVVNHYLFLQIAPHEEMGKNGEKAGMENLHLTTQGPKWWTNAFAQGGWKLKKDLSLPSEAARKDDNDVTYVRIILEK